MIISSMITITWILFLHTNIYVLTSTINPTKIIPLRKGLIDTKNLTMSLKTIVSWLNFRCGVSKGASLRPSSPLLFYMAKVWVFHISRESQWTIELIHKQFISYNLRIRGNIPYLILLIEASLSPIKSMTMFRYLKYKKKLYNMDSNRFPKFSSNFGQNPHLQLKCGWNKDAQSWLNHWGIKEEITWRIRIVLKILLLPDSTIKCGMVRIQRGK